MTFLRQYPGGILFSSSAALCCHTIFSAGTADRLLRQVPFPGGIPAGAGAGQGGPGDRWAALSAGAAPRGHGGGALPRAAGPSISRWPRKGGAAGSCWAGSERPAALRWRNRRRPDGTGDREGRGAPGAKGRAGRTGGSACCPGPAGRRRSSSMRRTTARGSSSNIEQMR